ncbi:DUF1919 domain-containing protein [Vibrio fluvialis]|nr:DUF1919 domain-containing protein [Vibrio fluvialis]MBY7774582.1 DUF1919 domain-containing protein [Vibrio fluvialis]MBY7778774.1 DUF1919 domain-containing protein [Vibrio fluvialis]MBY7988192.1 DUF1919 domain-containing protein [Vibrio fluvialis]MBY7993772.1 DUF1919 domain-containing protein [Vibrio fluvialis]
MFKITKIINSIVDANIKYPNFSLISNNCWGYEMFKNSSLPYLTPFVGLFLYPDSYLKLLDNPVYYLNYNLETVDFNFDEYPIAAIYDIEIHFLHYESIEEAKVKWNRRRQRLLQFIDVHGLDSVIIKFCNRDSPTKEQVEKFGSLTYKRKIYIDGRLSSLLIENEGMVFSGKKLYSLRFLYPLLYRRLFK